MVLFSAYIYAAICISVCVCVCACSMYSLTIALFDLMFLLTKPTLNKVYFTLLLLYFITRTNDDQIMLNCVASQIHIEFIK